MDPGQPRVGPADASVTPRFAGIATFARLPTAEQVSRWDIAVAGVPFDGGTSYRPGARFGPAAVRQGSRLLRPYHPALDAVPFESAQVVDAGDLACSPFDNEAAVTQIQAGADGLLSTGGRLVAVGGDHTIALPLLRATARRHGPLALVHFDAHLDTWDTYFGERYTHGTPFRRAWEEDLLRRDRSIHVGLRGPLYSSVDLSEDADMGFAQVTTDDVAALGPAAVTELRAGPGGGRTRLRLGRHRRPRPGARTGNRDARGRRAHQPGAARPPPRPSARTGGRGRRGRGLPGLRPRGDHGHRRGARALRAGHAHGAAAASERRGSHASESASGL